MMMHLSRVDSLVILISRIIITLLLFASFVDDQNVTHLMKSATDKECHIIEKFAGKPSTHCRTLEMR